MIRELIKIWWSNSFTLMTTTEHPQTFRGLPSLSILHKPLHSPNFLFESTRINGIWCSLHKAVINFLYCGSSQLSAKIAKTAWRLHGNFELIEICVLRTDRISVAGSVCVCVRVLGNLHVKSFACLVNTTYQTVGNEGLLQHFLQSCVDVHWATNNWCGWSFTVNSDQVNSIVIKQHSDKNCGFEAIPTFIGSTRLVHIQWDKFRCVPLQMVTMPHNNEP